jgi:hypothetical protein
MLSMCGVPDVLVCGVFGAQNGRGMSVTEHIGFPFSHSTKPSYVLVVYYRRSTIFAVYGIFK